MGFGVFIHRSDSIYDDSPAERYQFPKQYLGRVEECVGDWILYYEPRKVPNTRGYFATAKVQEIVPDPAPGMHIALIEPGSYLDFPDPVPFMGIDGIAERGVLNEAGQISGRAVCCSPNFTERLQSHHRVGLGPGRSSVTSCRRVFVRILARTGTFHF
jgi:putative restriction endonuclease